MGAYYNGHYHPRVHEFEAMHWCNNRGIEVSTAPNKNGKTVIIIDNNGNLRAGKKRWEYHQQREAIFEAYVKIRSHIEGDVHLLNSVVSIEENEAIKEYVPD